MDTVDINKALQKIGISQRQIGESLDPPVTQPMVSYVISKKIISARVMRAVAKALGRDVAKVFPEYFCHPNPRPRKKTAQKEAA